MIVFTFPGQGSQTPGIGSGWVDHPSWQVVHQASEATGRDVEHLLLRADADELRVTDNAQLSTYVASLLVLEAVRGAGVDAQLAAGHSLGEYTALTAAGVFTVADGARLVAARGSAMREACNSHDGTMAAVLGADDADVEEACAAIRSTSTGTDADVWVANSNAPGQVVIAGSPAGVAAGGEACKAAGAKRVMAVAVSGAFHTPYMAPAQAALDAALADVTVNDAAFPVAANVDALCHTAGDEWRALLSRQLCSPVRWAALLEGLSQRGATTFLELGPGTVLSGMAKRTVKDASLHSASTPAEVDALVEALAGR